MSRLRQCNFNLKALKKTRVNRQIVRLAAPATLAMINHTVVMISDTIMIGNIDKDHLLTAAGQGGLLIYTMISIFFGISLALQIIVARRVGENNFASAGAAFTRTLILATGLSLIFLLIGLAFHEQIALFLNDDIHIASSIDSFITYRFFGLVPYVVLYIYRGFYDGIGLTTLTMVSAFVTSGSNVFFNYILIYGHFGSVALGIKGAAFASSLAPFFGMIVFWVYRYHSRFKKFFEESVISTRAMFGQILKISTPVALENLILHVGFIYFLMIAAKISPTSSDAANVIISLLSISFMPGFALSIAATTILGQAVGARKPMLAKLAANRSAFYAAIIMGIIGMGFIIGGKPLIRLFKNDNKIVEEAFLPMVLVSLVQVFDAMHMVYAGALRSAGKVYFVLMGYFVASFVVMLPLSYLLGVQLNYGSSGLWLGLTGWIVYLGILFYWRFNRLDLKNSEL